MGCLRLWVLFACLRCLVWIFCILLELSLFVDGSLLVFRFDFGELLFWFELLWCCLIWGGW